jgi:glycosyltransferase involved in cell wall biosynthesis
MGIKTPLRIGVDICSLAANKAGGITTYITELLRQFNALDGTNEYILFETRDSQFPVSNPRWKKVVLPTFLPGSLWNQLLFPFYLLKYKIDVLWSPTFFCPLWGPRRMKRFITIHDLTLYHFPETMIFKDMLLLRLLVPLSARRSTAVFTDSQFIKKDIENRFYHLKTPIIAVPLGKPEWTIPSEYRSEKRLDFLFFAGNLEPRKNLINSIKALEILYSRGKSVELQIASPSGWRYKEILDFVNHSPIKRNINFLGFLSLPELQKKYLACKALLYPSFYEGFGLPVLEALALDCVVVTSRNTVMEEIAENAAMYFDPWSPADIAEKIGFVYSKDFDRSQYLQHKNRILEKYSWDSAAGSMLSFFES